MDNESMIIRLSGKLGDKIDANPDDKLPPHENPYLDWSGHLFRAPRKQYILITNTASLYSIIIEGRGIIDGDLLREKIVGEWETMLDEDGFQSIFKHHIKPAVGEYSFSKALNRTVIGSMNDLVRLAESRLGKQGYTPHETAIKLNETPFSYLDYGYPREAFQELKSGQGLTE